MKENRGEPKLIITLAGSFCAWDADLRWLNSIRIHNRNERRDDQWSIDKRGKIIGDS